MLASPGVSTGACIGHVSPEALEGGPIGRLLDGDLIRVVVDGRQLVASIDLVGHGEERWTAEEAAAVLARTPDEAPTSRPTRAYRLTRRSGRGCSRRAAGSGADACTTSEAIGELLDAAAGRARRTLSGDVASTAIA